MKQFKRVDSIKGSPCPKCGIGVFASVKYCSGDPDLGVAVAITTERCRHGFQTEHLAITCGTCGYVDNMACADAPAQIVDGGGAEDGAVEAAG